MKMPHMKGIKMKSLKAGKKVTAHVNPLRMKIG